ncbi:holo-[acyl-carrier-protein] synthase [Chloroflexia bacterium SDU3-3]|nr:holo-[acyl-carrier-protein] synthase [Chloroflexia bacterium SDU3-3]
MLFHGVDLIEVARVADALERHGQRFLARVFTSAELAESGGSVASLAARFAAKEAVAKLLGVGIRGLGAGCDAAAIGWREAEVRRTPGGPPAVVLSGRAAQRAALLGLGPIAISLSHTRLHAIASAVAQDAQ